jgi:predicted RNA binding protein YcfA (HicA-like mRNA interferase family)
VKQVSGRELIAALHRIGWSVARVHGSHHILTHPDNPVRISVPLHGNRPLKRGLLRHLVKLARLDEADI